MTVSSTSSRVVHVGNGLMGGQATFPCFNNASGLLLSAGCGL